MTYAGMVVIEAVLGSGREFWVFRGHDAQTETQHHFRASVAAIPRRPAAGEVWGLTGPWVDDPKYGRQIEVRQAHLEKPSGRLIVDFLSGRSFPDVGRGTAQALWERYEEGLYDHLDQGNREVLLAALGGENARTARQVQTILDGWKDASLESAVCRWLDRHGFSSRLARKVMDCYGSDTIQRLQDNPYRLTAFTDWRSVDETARSMGVGDEDERRLISAVEAALYDDYDHSHTVVPKENLEDAVGKLLARPELASLALSLAVEDEAVRRVSGGWQALGPAVMEQVVAERLFAIRSGADAAGLTRQLFHQAPSAGLVDEAIARFEAEERYALNAAQREAVHMVATSRLSVLTGGAGVGKTSVLKAVLAVAERLRWSTHLMALSGRAALRMTEATHHEAATIRLFLVRVQEGQLSLDDEPLLVIDESSMVDLALLYEILTTVPAGCRLLMVGDDGQLPPIGPGITFHGIVQDDLIPRVTLTETMRQAAETGIPAFAEAIRKGQVPEIANYSDQPEAGVTFLECDQSRLVDAILDVMGRLGGIGSAQVVGSIKGGLDPKGAGYKPGTRMINAAFHRLAMAGRERRLLFERFLADEPVIWLQNDREIGLMNGELGRVLGEGEMESPQWRAAVKNDEPTNGLSQFIPALILQVDKRKVSVPDYDARNPRRIEHAYAISTHKSQGSQFPRVIVPVTPSQIMDRTMLYTAVTRAKTKVILVGSRDVFGRAVSNPPSYSVRRHGMNEALRSAGLALEEREGYADY